MARRTDDREFMLRVREAAVALLHEDYVDHPLRSEMYYALYLKYGGRPSKAFEDFKECVFAVLEQLDCVEECINKYDGVEDAK